MDLSLQLYRKLLGILFKEKGDPNLKYPLYTIEDHEKGYERIEYTPDYPSCICIISLSHTFGTNSHNDICFIILSS